MAGRARTANASSLCADAAPVIATLKAAPGIRFGYHNHAFEFARMEGTRAARCLTRLWRTAAPTFCWKLTCIGPRTQG